VRGKLDYPYLPQKSPTPVKSLSAWDQKVNTTNWGASGESGPPSITDRDRWEIRNWVQVRVRETIRASPCLAPGCKTQQMLESQRQFAPEATKSHDVVTNQLLLAQKKWSLSWVKRLESGQKDTKECPKCGLV
jgi:hypothetical protein